MGFHCYLFYHPTNLTVLCSPKNHQSQATPNTIIKPSFLNFKNQPKNIKIEK
ncbi:hypothetical protein PLUTE_b0674 [Pseudoalteromonas luteoviolacea DSM 6061]|nr:hypothetical protein [Pseudoalteromonas luteoviolacea DSM 6061]